MDPPKVPRLSSVEGAERRVNEAVQACLVRALDEIASPGEQPLPGMVEHLRARVQAEHCCRQRGEVPGRDRG